MPVQVARIAVRVHVPTLELMRTARLAEMSATRSQTAIVTGEPAPRAVASPRLAVQEILAVLG